MAIVKMSEFNLLVPNETVDGLLRSFQIFSDITFKDNSSLADDIFAVVANDYDFEDNRSKQNHIQSILAKLNEYQRKSSKEKTKFLDSLGVMEMSWVELERRVQESDLDELLDTYAEFYESRRDFPEGYDYFIPWENSRMHRDDLVSLSEQEPLIGTLDHEEISEFENELNRLQSVYYISRDDERNQQRIYIIFTQEKENERAQIIADKYELVKRSSVSLHIEEDVDAMHDLLTQYIDKRTNIEQRISSIGHYKEVLQMHYEFLRNEELCEATKTKFIKSKYVTYISGWVISEEAEKFSQIVTETAGGVCDLDINDAPLHAKDVPIKLKNNKFNSAFETITSMYSVPRYDELDPTPIFAPWYALFFGMMLADVGYGLLMAVVMFVVLKLVNLKPSTENFIRLLFYVGFATIFWGFIYGSFFGGMIAMHPLIDINQDFTSVLVLALGMGIVHLFIGLAVKGYIYVRDYKKRYVLYDVIFWYITLGSAIMLVSGMFTDIFDDYASIALWVMIAGMVGIVLTNGRDAKTFFGKFASGLYSLYGITNYVGDIVSYSRLMALGLAGSSIGMAFNMMMDMVSGNGIIGVIASIIIFIIGHSFNLFISGLSAYVHSARLTYVEFFGKFYVGGGRPFSNFRAKPTYINIH